MKARILFALLALATPLAGQEDDQVPEPDGPQRRLGFETFYEQQAVGRDEWQSEALADAIYQRLVIWKQALEATPIDFAPILADCPACRVGRLRGDLEIVSRTPSITLSQATGTESGAGMGPDALEARLVELTQPIRAASERRIAFKVYRVEPMADRTRVRVQYHGFGRLDDGAVQQNSTWIMEWNLDGESPHVLSLRVAEHDEATMSRPEPLLSDCTLAVLGRNDSFDQQLRPSLHHWLRSLDRMSGVTFRGFQGLSVGDLDGDGLDDLFVAQPGGLPDKLFLQQADATALDVSAEAAIDYLELSRMALIVDLDNDGDQDLAVVKSAHVVVMANDGDAHFRPVAALPLDSAVMVSAGDYDADGDLDLFGVAYRNPDEGLPPTPYYDALNGQANRLYRNEGNLDFVDATAEAGLDVDNRRFSFSAVWEDYDNDGDLDIYVANDFGRNNLYQNRGGRFVDVAAEAGVEDISAGMGATWADYDLDGNMDVYVSNMFSSAGGRVTYQRNFRSDDESRELFQRHARGNSLFKGLGDGRFADVSEEAGVMMGKWAWGALFADLDNNGLADIFVPNGFLTNARKDDL